MGEYARHGKETPESARERGFSYYKFSLDEKDDEDEELYTNRSDYSNTGHFRKFHLILTH